MTPSKEIVCVINPKCPRAPNECPVVDCPELSPLRKLMNAGGSVLEPKPGEAETKFSTTINGN